MKRPLWLVVVVLCATATRSVPDNRPTPSAANWSSNQSQSAVCDPERRRVVDGISMELWRDLADDNDWDYELREMEPVALLEAVERGDLDAAVAEINVTHEREKILDFSYPYYSSGLGIAVRRDYRHNWVSALSHLLAWEFLMLMLILTAMAVVFGVLMWLVERRRNPDHFGGLFDGLGQGIWWAVVTMTTVGYGDKSPRTLLGRVVAVFWMVVGVVSLAVVTGSVASQMTVAQLNSPVRGPEDLPYVRTGTVAGTTSETYLRDRGIGRHDYATETDRRECADRTRSRCGGSRRPGLAIRNRPPVRGAGRSLAGTFRTAGLRDRAASGEYAPQADRRVRHQDHFRAGLGRDGSSVHGTLSQRCRPPAPMVRTGTCRPPPPRISRL